MTGAGVCAAVGAGSPHHSKVWYLAAGIVFGVGVLVALVYFGVHPLMVALDGWRARKIGELRAGRPAPPPRAVAAGHTGGLEIVEAHYGANGAWADVKSYLGAQIAGDRISMLVGNDTLGGDPIYGTPKTLKVTYRVGNSQEGRRIRARRSAVGDPLTPRRPPPNPVAPCPVQSLTARSILQQPASRSCSRRLQPRQPGRNG